MYNSFSLASWKKHSGWITLRPFSKQFESQFEKKNKEQKDYNLFYITYVTTRISADQLRSKRSYLHCKVTACIPTAA
jgi:hypothetical protein